MGREERLRRQQEFLVKSGYWAIWGISGVLVIKFVGPVLLPFVAAFLIAWLLRGPVAFVERRIHLRRSLAAIVVVVLFYGLAVFLLYFAGRHVAGLVREVFAEVTAFLSETVYPLAEAFVKWLDGILGGGEAALKYAGDEAAQMAGQASGYVGGESEVMANLAARYVNDGSAQVTARTAEMLSDVSGALLSGVSDAAASIPGICMNVLLTVIATVFMELEFPAVVEFARRQIPARWQKAVAEGKSYVLFTLGRCFLSYGLILLMTFAELAVGFLVLGVERAVVIAFLVAVLDILPVLGTGTVLIPWTVIAFASKDTGMAVGLLTLYLIITVVRNIVEPRLVGRQMGLSPVVMLPCMLVGLKFFGLFGLFGVPLCVALLKSLNDRGLIHIFRGAPGGQEEAG